MPSLEQCDSASSMAALPSAMEIFDKFKPQENGIGNGNKSDSEESFHLQLDDDDNESHSNASSGKNSVCNLHEETEEDILNKFDTSFKSEHSDLDAKPELEECLINMEIDGDSKTDNFPIEGENDVKEHLHFKVVLKTTNCDDEEYEHPSEEGEFKSLYELEDEPTLQPDGSTIEAEPINEDFVVDSLQEPNSNLHSENVCELPLISASHNICDQQSLDSYENIEEKALTEAEEMEYGDISKEPNLVQNESTIIEKEILLEESVNPEKQNLVMDTHSLSTISAEKNILENNEEVLMEHTEEPIDSEEVEENLESNTHMLEDTTIVNHVDKEKEEQIIFNNTSDEPEYILMENNEALMECPNDDNPINRENQEEENQENCVETPAKDSEIGLAGLADEDINSGEEHDEGEELEQVLKESTQDNALENCEKQHDESEYLEQVLKESKVQDNSLENSEKQHDESEQLYQVPNESKVQDDTLKNCEKEQDESEQLEQVLKESKVQDDILENCAEDDFSVNEPLNTIKVSETVKDKVEAETETIGEVINPEEEVFHDKSIELTKENQENEENNTDDLEKLKHQNELATKLNTAKILETGNNYTTDQTESNNYSENKIASVTERIEESVGSCLYEIVKSGEEPDTGSPSKIVAMSEEASNEESSDMSMRSTDLLKIDKTPIKQNEIDPLSFENDVNNDDNTTTISNDNERGEPKPENKSDTVIQPEINATNENSCDNDESDLLDISIIRDAEEDDACAMAIAIEDLDAQDQTQTSEKSDEETIDAVDEDDHVGDDDIDDDNHNADPLTFDEDEINMEVDQDSDHLLDTESEDITLKDKDDNHLLDMEDTSLPMLDTESQDTNLKDKDENQLLDTEDPSLTEKEKEEDEKEKLDGISKDVRLIDPDKNSEVESKEQMDEPKLIMETGDKRTKKIEAAPPTEESIHIDDESNDSTTQINKTDNLDKAKEAEKVDDVTEKPYQIAKQVDAPVENLENRRYSTKRTLSGESDNENKETAQKKRKLSEAVIQDSPVKDTPSDKVKTLTAFAKYMQCKKFASKLSRSDLEQFCIQKICETFIAKSEEGEVHHTIRKQERLIDGLRKDLQQLTKQCKDLEIVNKKLMNELRTQHSNKKPLVPLKITRSVGLQVRLSTGTEPPLILNNRKRPSTTPVVAASPQKQTPVRPTPVNNPRARMPSNPPVSPVVKQATPAPSPQKSSPLITASTTVQTTTVSNNTLLSQALQQNTPVTTARGRPPGTVAKRTAAATKKISNAVSTPPTMESPKPNNPGVIDLTDEDDKKSQTVSPQQLRIINKVASGATVGKPITLNKVMNKSVVVSNQGKTGSPNKTAPGTGTPARMNLQPGMRLTPGSLINTSTASGSPQMVYVLPTVGNGTGAQKIAFVNLPTTLNGNAVMSKPITLKTAGTMRTKHPAPLPLPPRLPPDPLLKPVPPKPHLTIKKIETGIILQWKMPYNLDLFEGIASYQLYAYQETNAPPNTDMWRKVGDVKALALPMACTLTQFADKNKYYFAVRSVDVHKRIGAFSDPEEISL